MARQIEDIQAYVSLFSDVCSRCEHLDPRSPLGKIKVCKAFPKGIPPEIWTGENDHTAPFPGDRGIQFKKKRLSKGGNQ